MNSKEKKYNSGHINYTIYRIKYKIQNMKFDSDKKIMAGSKNNFGSEKNFEVRKSFWVQKFFLTQNKFWVRINFLVKTNLKDKKYFWSHKMLGPNIF